MHIWQVRAKISNRLILSPDPCNVLGWMGPRLEPAKHSQSQGLPLCPPSQALPQRLFLLRAFAIFQPSCSSPSSPVLQKALGEQQLLPELDPPHPGSKQTLPRG